MMRNVSNVMLSVLYMKTFLLRKMISRASDALFTDYWLLRCFYSLLQLLTDIGSHMVRCERCWALSVLSEPYTYNPRDWVNWDNGQTLSPCVSDGQTEWKKVSFWWYAMSSIFMFPLYSQLCHHWSPGYQSHQWWTLTVAIQKHNELVITSALGL